MRPDYPPSACGPLAAHLARNRCLLLDGGLATHLETLGLDLSGGLWSARALHEAPGVIEQAHLDYLRAGADCITSASYQASIPGFRQAGFSAAAARELIGAAVEVALSARDRYWREAGCRQALPRPLVAASVGPYGAYLADGSEYTGAYRVGAAELRDFHGERFGLLASSPADLLAIETIPSYTETEVLLELLTEQCGTCAWVSFSCKDATSLWDGTPLREAASMAARHPAVVAVGANCIAPRFARRLVSGLCSLVPKPVLVYPNSGERYDARTGRWHGERDPRCFAHMGLAWHRAGASVIGGCCRTGPAHIAAMRLALDRLAEGAGGGPALYSPQGCWI